MLEELDPQKYHIITNKKKRLILVALAFLFFVVFPSLFYFYYKFAVFRPSQTDREITLEIDKGDSVFEISGKLFEKEAINSEFLFVLYVFLNRSDTSIQAGTFTIKAGTNLVQLVEQLKHGRNDMSLTFLEGWRVEQYAIIASQTLEKINYNDFVNISKEYEGYLFPDTYYVNKDIQEEELLEILTDNFNRKTKDLLSEENLKKVGLTREQVVIFASLVEREVSNPKDRPIVAGILIKRWGDGMKLDVDATTQYSIAFKRLCKDQTYCVPNFDDLQKLNWWPNNLTREDLDDPNSYNTRAVIGLPPTPISSVSLSSINAVINYQETPYYYYLTDNKGIAYYAETLAKHNENISNYLSK